MFETLIQKASHLFKGLSDAVRDRRERKLIAAAAIERKERKALVQGLTDKLEAARLGCEQKGQTATSVVLSLQEIEFIEWNLSAWTRHLKASEIYSASSRR